ADAYGHGVQYIAPALDKAGAAWFGVSNIEEALQLRSLKITKPILIFGYTPPEMAKTLADHDISQAMFSEEYARLLSKEAVLHHVQVKIHFKIDTGMSRLGFLLHDPSQTASVAGEIASLCTLPGLKTEGIFTHFASADYDGDQDGSFTENQFSLFQAVTEALGQRGVVFAIKHCCNSAGTIVFHQMHLDMIRPGIILYGLCPAKELTGRVDLRPVMELKSVVSMVKTIESGASVSYGRTYRSDREMKVATIPIGYADGYSRLLSGKADILIGGKRARVIGRICMDQMVVDVSDIEDVYEGQIVTIFGTDKDETVTIEEVSALVGTINYETVCLIGKRVPRVFFEKGKQTGQINYIYDGR
ncbi:MAG: alanine racemase, partial [Clostridiales bacterium 43-6]